MCWWPQVTGQCSWRACWFRVSLAGSDGTAWCVSVCVDQEQKHPSLPNYSGRGSAACWTEGRRSPEHWAVRGPGFPAPALLRAALRVSSPERPKALWKWALCAVLVHTQGLSLTLPCPRGDLCLELCTLPLHGWDHQYLISCPRTKIIIDFLNFVASL